MALKIFFFDSPVNQHQSPRLLLNFFTKQQHLIICIINLCIRKELPQIIKFAAAVISGG
jgi:hypothetical protein